jgi:hypothetical protein
MKRFAITKLDRRHTGYKQFTHYISPVYKTKLEDKLDFIKWRKWCWENFGPGIERDYAVELGSDHYDVCRWAWHTPLEVKRIYFSTERDLSHFCLFWS